MKQNYREQYHSNEIPYDYDSLNDLNLHYVNDQEQLTHIKRQFEDLKRTNQILTEQLCTQQLKQRKLQRDILRYKNQLQEKQEIIQDLTKQSERMNEQLFQYQQRIAQIDLQIQDKVEQGIAQNITKQNNTQYIQTIRKLNEQIEVLNRRTKQKNNKQSENKLKQRQLAYKEKQLDQRDQQLVRRWQQVQMQKEHNCRWQTELFKMQDQLKRKLNDLKLKEQQVQLIKMRSNENFKSALTYQIKNINHQRPSYHTNVQTHKKIYPSAIQRYQYKKKNSETYERESSINSKTSQFNSKIYNISRNRQYPSINNPNQVHSSASHNQKQLKIYRSGVNFHNNNNNKSNSNLITIESKLERLRSQIRKQIDSIK